MRVLAQLLAVLGSRALMIALVAAVVVAVALGLSVSDVSAGGAPCFKC